MKNIRKFESYMSREEMCSVLCRCGYNISELEECSNQELEEMCRASEEEANHLSNNTITQEKKIETRILKGLKEHQETNNYMFFGNLKTIKRLVDELLEMNESEIDTILTNGHNWAVDHIATSKDDIEEVFNFLAGHSSPSENEIDFQYSEPSHEETEGRLANKDLEDEMKNIKSFGNFGK